jgi:glucokinase
MNKETHYVVGIDLGGTKILSAVVNSQGEILSRDHSLTPSTSDYRAVVKSIVGSAKSALSQAGMDTSRVEAVGVGAAGISNPQTGILFTSPNLPSLRSVPLRDIIAQEMGKKTFLTNDANAAALGEFYFGAGRGTRHFIYVTISTGIGGGIIIDGKLYAGATGAAGEVGHMIIDDQGPPCNCGSRGCWETLASGTALAREARRRIEKGAKTSILDYAKGDLSKVTAQIIHTAAQNGDNLAKELIAQTGYYVGLGLANLINIFNPELIVIGGGLSNIGDMLLEPAFKVACEMAYIEAYNKVRFARAALGQDSGVLGSAIYALGEIAKQNG